MTSEVTDRLTRPAYPCLGSPTDEAIEYYFSPVVSSPRHRELFHAYQIALEKNPWPGSRPG